MNNTETKIPFIDILIESSYKEFSHSYNRSLKAFQKRFLDDEGKTKYFLNFYLYDLAGVRHLNEPDYRWTVEAQFEISSKGLTFDSHASWTFTENKWNWPISTLQDVEDFFEKLFTKMEFDRYDDNF